jgi:hypothetical protein
MVRTLVSDARDLSSILGGTIRARDSPSRIHQSCHLVVKIRGFEPRHPSSILGRTIRAGFALKNPLLQYGVTVSIQGFHP